MFLELGSVPGYRQAEVLYQGESSRVVAATRLVDGRAVVLKALVADENNERAVLARARQELELTRRSAGTGVVAALGLERAGLEPALVLERISGQTLLSRLGGRPLSVDAFFAVAVPLARAVAQVHAARVIHRDIKPENVLVSDDWSPTLIDFGIAVVLPRGQDELREPGILQGSLPYLAPEQSGRMNRGVDMRTDLYSLGITFYEMLAGQTPFHSVGDDALALVHAHLTRPPPAIAERRGALPLPPALEQIVGRLLAKQPEERYQSARGLVLDLERAARAGSERGPSASGNGASLFPLSTDLPDHLVFSGRLHGRPGVSEALAEALAESRAGLPVLALCTGPTGVGKTAHAEALRTSVQEGGGLWAQGRFAADQQHRPYSAFREALGGLCGRLLAEPDQVLQGWRTRLSLALGSVAPVAAEVVPELERLIGKLPPPAPLGPAETHHRFVLAMRRLVGALATASEPLVLFLDDLPQADPASLQLLEALITGPSPQWLMVLATASDVEDEAERSKLASLLTRAAERERLRQIVVPPLTSREMTDWLSELLHLPVGEVQALAAVVGRKSGDNPSFAQQLLRHLEQTGRLRLDAQGRWSFVEAEVAAAELPDDLSAAMRGKLTQLPASARQVAAWASTMFGDFSVSELDAVVRERADAASVDVPAAIAELAEQGLLSVAEGRYRFSHPTLQQAAGAILPPEECRELHAVGGWRLCGERGPDEDAEASALFAMAGHFHAAYGGDAGASARDALPLGRRRQVVSVFRLAGERALASTAYQTAIRHLQAASAAADPALMRDRPAEAFAIELGAAKALFFDGKREAAEQSFERLSTRPLSLRQSAEARSAHVALLTYAGELARAVAVGLEGLRQLGLRLSEKPSAVSLMPRLASVLLRLRRRKDDKLLDGPRTTSDKVEATVMLIDAVGPAAYWSNAKLYAGMHLANMHMQLGSGYTASVSYAFAKQALLYGGLLNDVPAALRMARLALSIQERLPSPAHAARIRTLMLMTVEAWKRPLSEVVDELPAATRACEEAGDLEYANYSTSLRMGLALASGMSLRTLRDQLEEAARRCSAWGYKEVAAVEQQSGLLVELLMGERDFDEQDPIGRRGVSFVETRAPLYLHATRALLVLQLLGRSADCFRLGEETADFGKALPGQCLVMEHHFWHGMAAATLLAQQAAEDDESAVVEASARQQRHWSRTLDRLIAALGRQSTLCPENNFARWQLLEAERCRLEGRSQDALRRYQRAADHAARLGVVHLEAVAHERRGTLLSTLGLTAESELFLGQAHDGYRRWGARRKCQLLEAEYPFLQRRTGGRDGVSTRRPASAGGLRGGARADSRRGGEAITSQRVDVSSFDVKTLLGTTQAISEERTVDGVLRRLLAAALTNAGAERGVLVLRRDGVAIVEAESQAHPDGDGDGFTRVGQPLEVYTRLPTSALRLVERTGTRLVLGNASADPTHGQDDYVRQAGVRSVLVAPIVRQGTVVGVVYLENNAVAEAFTPERVEILQLLATQAAISLDNAQLYSGLEAKVESRARQLDIRNQQLRLVLDNVEQGFLTVDPGGKIVGERSRVVERWLGDLPDGTSLARAIEQVDPGAGRLLGLAWEALMEDVLPFEVLMDQLPRRFSLAAGAHKAPGTGARVFELTYRPLYDESAGGSGAGARFSQMLVVISDVTESVARQSSERTQRELVEIFQRIVRDRPGVEEFRAEASLLVMAISGGMTGSLADLKRALHTLKGNAGLFGLGTLVELCAAAETDIEETGVGPPAGRLREIRARWQELDATLSSFLGSGPRDTVELHPSEVEQLVSAIERGEPAPVLTGIVAGWARESMVDRLGRIADQVRRLGRAAGKGEVRVVAEPNDLRLDGEAWASFWSALVHVLRNAIDHGLERPEERLAAGKLHPPTIIVRTMHSGGNLVIEVADDGRGVAWERIAAKAREAGLPAETQEHLVAALFSDGLSTGDDATELSGRGVGAGAVRAECEARGGRVEVRSVPGRGTTFSFIFPLAEGKLRPPSSGLGMAV